jgi:hypothetical protein
MWLSPASLWWLSQGRLRMALPGPGSGPTHLSSSANSCASCSGSGHLCAVWVFAAGNFDAVHMPLLDLELGMFVCLHLGISGRGGDSLSY